VVSNQPYVGYQEAVIRYVLPSSFYIDAIGPRAAYIPSMEILLDNFAKWMRYSRLNAEKLASENLSHPSR